MRAACDVSSTTCSTTRTATRALASPWRRSATRTASRLTVEDDGDGVAPNIRARVFERFVRAGDDDRSSGLGLAICRAIARAHDGDIALEDRSRFVVRLPAFRMS